MKDLEILEDDFRLTVEKFNDTFSILIERTKPV